MLNIKDRIVGSILIVIALSWSIMAFGELPGKKAEIEVDVSTVGTVVLDVPAGQLNISGTTGQTIKAEVVVTCSKDNGAECNKRVLEEIVWSIELEGDLARLRLIPEEADQYNDISIVASVGVPQDKMLTVNLDYGDLDLQGTNACLDVNVKAGNVKLGLQEKPLASANLKATFGDVSLTTSTGTVTRGKRSKIVGAKLEWRRDNGICHVDAKVRAGNIELNLE